MNVEADARADAQRGEQPRPPAGARSRLAATAACSEPSLLGLISSTAAACHVLGGPNKTLPSKLSVPLPPACV